MNLKGLKINFLGDSITQGHGVQKEESIYLNILKREAELSEARNYGIGGTRFALQEADEKNGGDTGSFSYRYKAMDDDADIIVVFGGTNDYGHGDAPIGGFSDRTPTTFYGACHFLFSKLIEKYEGKPIVIMTPLHRLNEERNTGDNKPEGVASLKEYVNIIREVAEYYSLPVLDLFKNSGMQPSVPVIQQKFIPDGLHPNENGHRIIADKLKVFLENL